MSTIREQVYEKLLAVLTAALPPLFPGIKLERNRDARFQTFPGINILDGPQTRDEPESTGIALYTTTATVEGYVQAEVSADLGPALNELHGQIVKALLANRTLDGLADDLFEGEMRPEIGERENQRPVMGFSLDVQIKFCTAESDPYRQGPGV